MSAPSRTALALTLGSCLSVAGCLVSFDDLPGGSLSQAVGGGPATGSSGAGESTAGEAATGGASSTLMIDDFEDGNNQVLLLAGRDGYWFTSNDGTGRQTPDPKAPALPELLMPARGASTRAMHTTGSGFSLTGAILGVNFVSNGPTALPYNASAYQGVTFSAKLGRLGVTTKARLAFTDYDTLYGCTLCGDHFGESVTFGNDFQTVQVAFADLKQAGTGKPLVAALDPTRVYSLEISWAKGETFDAWIDDISFY